MRLVEFTDTNGSIVLVNAGGVLFLRALDGDRTELHLSGRAEPLLLAAAAEEVAQALEAASPEPPEPTLALVS